MSRLFDNFNLPDLVAYCKRHSLKATGKKKDVIKRILESLSGGTPKSEKRKAETEPMSDDAKKTKAEL